jgi:hypothetical protein
MCPVCAASLALVATGAASGGSLTALAMSKFLRRKQTNEIKGNQNETARDGTKN